MNRNLAYILAIIGVILVLIAIEYIGGFIGFSFRELGSVKMEFDFISYLLGIIATVIGSTTVAFFANWIQTRALKKRAISSLFSEIKHNHTLVRNLLGENNNYISKHWAYEHMPFSKASFDNAKQNGFLYNLKPITFERISQAYDIISLIEKKGYGPKGTARNTFEKLGEIFTDIIKEMES